MDLRAIVCRGQSGQRRYTLGLGQTIVPSGRPLGHASSAWRILTARRDLESTPWKNDMARPRVFISSTFYDLRQIRDDLERFVRDLGYEPVRHETGAIPYGHESPPEEYAYREVETCDIVVAVIGGRFGSASAQDPLNPCRNWN